MPYNFAGGSSQYLSGGTYTSSYAWSGLAWIKVGAYASFPAGSGTVFSSNISGGAYPFLRVSTSGHVEFWFDWGTGIGGWQGPASDVPEGTWTCIAASYAGTATSDDPVLYSRVLDTDATLQTLTVTETATPSGGQNSLTGATVYVGQRGDGQRIFDGHIAYLQVWHRALSFGELCQAMVKPGSVRANLQFYRPLLGDTLDWAGDALSLTATGAAVTSSGPPVVLDEGEGDSWMSGVTAAFEYLPTFGGARTRHLTPLLRR